MRKKGGEHAASSVGESSDWRVERVRRRWRRGSCRELYRSRLGSCGLLKGGISRLRLVVGGGGGSVVGFMYNMDGSEWSGVE